LRQQEEIDSKYGFVAHNIDYIWENPKTGQWMLLEEKMFNGKLSGAQERQFKRMHNRVKHYENYYGFFIVTFERTSLDDGAVYINGKQVTKDELIRFLKFEITYPCYFGE